MLSLRALSLRALSPAAGARKRAWAIALSGCWVACASTSGGQATPPDAVVEIEPEPAAAPQPRADGDQPEWEQPAAKRGQPCESDDCHTGVDACDAFIDATLRCGPRLNNDLRQAMQTFAELIRKSLRSEADPAVRQSLIDGCVSALEALERNDACLL